MFSNKNYKPKLIFWLVFLISLFLFFSPMQFYIVRVVSRHFGYADKIAHFLVFLLLAYFGRKAYTKNKKLLLFLVIYIFLIELIQFIFISTRNFEIIDILSGWAGIAAGWGIFLI